MNSLANNKQFDHNRIHPYLFALWVGIASILMVFGSLTSAYIVRRSAGNWLEFELPNVFALSTLVILLSSASLHASYSYYKKGNESMYKGMLWLTMLLGLGFIFTQYQGWQAMNEIGATFTANPSSSFIYVISGFHVAHLLGGIAALVSALVFAYALPFAITNKRTLRLKLVVNYWHFVDLLWVYLFLFFYFV